MISLNQLEVLSRNIGGGGNRPPLLLVHGAWHGAWCWEEGFLDRVAQQGFEVHAMSLRGHGNSAGRNLLHFARVRDFVDDVEIVVGSLHAPPVVVGHSMGGFLVQKVMGRRQLAGAVLLASAPPYGITEATGKIARHAPFAVLQALLTLNLKAPISTPRMARRFLFSDQAHDDLIERFVAKSGNESALAYLELLRFDPVTPIVGTDVLVIGAGRDFCIPNETTVRIAKIYHTTAILFSEMGHELMLEPGWEAVADTITAWVGKLVGGITFAQEA